MKKYSLAVMVFIMTSLLYRNLYSFEEGFIWGLRANFNGTYTMPSISQEDLNKLGAGYMKGAAGYTMDGEAELGYLFGAKRWFKIDYDKMSNMDKTNRSLHVFSGMSLYVSIGVGSGFAGQVAGNTMAGVTANMFMNVNYAPVISFGVGSKIYLLESRLALGLQVGGKIIADTSPEYLVYSDTDLSSIPAYSNVSFPEMGEIIVTDFMMKNMNPVMFSIKAMLEYNQPISDRVEIILGIYARYNIYKPKYITMPDSLLSILKTVSSNFTTTTPLNSYFINSLDFGLSLGLQFRG